MKKYTSTIAAFLLIIAACWDITVHSGNELGESDKRNKIEKQAHKFCERQNVQYYLHVNSKPYKQSLKMDTLFAERLDSIDAEVNKNTTHKPYMPK